MLRKPTAADNYASTTTIGTCTAIPVATGTDTLITFPNVSLGDVSTGIEIQVDAACGAVTTKNFFSRNGNSKREPSLVRSIGDPTKRSCATAADIFGRSLCASILPFPATPPLVSATLSKK